MSWQPRVLLVAPSPVLAKDLFAWLTEAGYDVALVTTFGAAKVQLELGVHLVIAELRLAEFNGLHLASRAQARSIPTIVVGVADPVLERDARQMGVTYMSGDVDREYLLALAGHLTEDAKEPDTPRLPSLVSANLAFISSGELMPVKSPRTRRFN